jgi:hypothetical protein
MIHYNNISISYTIYTDNLKPFSKNFYFILLLDLAKN